MCGPALLGPFIFCPYILHPEHGTVTVPTSSGVCGQCESVHLARGLTGASGGDDGGDDSAGNGFTRRLCVGMAFISSCPSTVSTTNLIPVLLSPLRSSSAFASEPLSSAFDLKLLPDFELKPKSARKKNQRGAVRVPSGASLEATLLRHFLQGPLIHHGLVSEKQTMQSRVMALIPRVCSAAHGLRT